MTAGDSLSPNSFPSFKTVISARYPLALAFPPSLKHSVRLF